jgi:hypothetical protein
MSDLTRSELAALLQHPRLRPDSEHPPFSMHGCVNETGMAEYVPLILRNVTYSARAAVNSVSGGKLQLQFFFEN